MQAKDVRLSKMISVCIVGVPMLWLSYAFLMFLVGYPIRQVVRLVLSHHALLTCQATSWFLVV